MGVCTAAFVPPPSWRLFGRLVNTLCNTTSTNHRRQSRFFYACIHQSVTHPTIGYSPSAASPPAYAAAPIQVLHPSDLRGCSHVARNTFGDGTGYAPPSRHRANEGSYFPTQGATAMSGNQKTRLIIASRDLRRASLEASTTQEKRCSAAAVLACEQRLARRRLFYVQVLAQVSVKGGSAN